MTRTRRFIAACAAALALSAVPGMAAAQPIGDCVDLPDQIVYYVCASVDPATGVEVIVRVDDTKYVVTVDGQGDLWVCVHQSDSHECIVEPN